VDVRGRQELLDEVDPFMAGVILLSLWLRDDFIEKASAEEPNGLTLCTAPFCGPGQVLRLHDMPASSIALS